jgi:hypothetical protein
MSFIGVFFLSLPFSLFSALFALEDFTSGVLKEARASFVILDTELAG